MAKHAKKAPQHVNEQILERIAIALEAIAPQKAPMPDLTAHPAYIAHGEDITAVEQLHTLPLDHLIAISAQKQSVYDNSLRHAQKLPSHDILLWGSRGMGKSALVKSTLSTLQHDDHDIALVQCETDRESLANLPRLFRLLGEAKRQFVLFIDDIGFGNDQNSIVEARILRSHLDGGAMARPDNIRLYVTSNRRAIIARHMQEQDDPVNPRDVVDDQLALADRFGLSLGFHNCTQDDYLEIVSHYAAHHNLSWQEEDALRWAKQRGHRSGRTAWQYIQQIAGEQSKKLKSE